MLVAEKESKIAEMEAASTGEAARLRATLETVKGEHEHEKEKESWEAATQALICFVLLNFRPSDSVYSFSAMSKLRQHGPFAFFCLLFILPTLVFGECTCEKGEGDGDWNKTEALNYKIGAIASILFAGGLGVRIPILRKIIPALHPDRNIFLIVKAFSAGVILVNIDGSYASYLVSPTAVGAMGYCYMWWTGRSVSDVMYVTSENMANAVATVSKQLENVHETLAGIKRDLSKKLKNLVLKAEEQKEITQLTANAVNEVNSKLTQSGSDLKLIHQQISGTNAKADRIESKQDDTISNLRHLYGNKGRLFTKPLQNVSA